jgi:hypothetical protein
VQLSILPVQTNGQILLRVEGPPGLVCVLETSVNLRSWVEQSGSELIDQTERVEFIVPVELTKTASYFRVRVK